MPTHAVFLDALGTLVELEPPWVLLRERVPPGISDERLVAAVRAEMAYYKAHAHEGRDPESLAELRDRCARVLSDELGTEVSTEELVDAVRMTAYADAEPALQKLKEREVPAVVVSNWDCSLGEVLERCGLAPLLDGAISSAEAGSRKPDPGIFRTALEHVGVKPSEALHVGDTPEEDVAGAAAAGIRALLLDRGGTGTKRGGDIASLTEIEEHL